jgi:cytochrome c-type biogenesis protein CcmH/NrfG
MSLLLDALKKAEEAKRLAAASANASANAPSANAPTTATEAIELSLEPVSAASGGAMPVSPLPELSAHLDTVDADLAAMPTNPALRKTTSAPPKHAAPPVHHDNNAEREAVRNVFAAKRTPAPNRNTLWIALGAVSVAAIGIGLWFWMQLQSVGGGSLSARPAPAATPNYAPPVAAYTPPPAPVAPLAAPAPQPMPEAPVAAEEARTEKPAKATPRPAEPESPVRISRGELRVNPTLAIAYERLQANDLGAAAEAYGKVLQADPKNIDALLGMAAIASRSGQMTQAESWYIRALEADPKDTNAQAGLINLRSQADPANAESRLKGLLATQPESASLNFALGNLYAGQQRWPDAQLAYFNAHTADPANPDYLFNLAASLDHMHLPKLALEYYQSALAASGGRKAGFDANQVRARILELQR